MQSITLQNAENTKLNNKFIKPIFNIVLPLDLITYATNIYFDI